MATVIPIMKTTYPSAPTSIARFAQSVLTGLSFLAPLGDLAIRLWVRIPLKSATHSSGRLPPSPG